MDLPLASPPRPFKLKTRDMKPLEDSAPTLPPLPPLPPKPPVTRKRSGSGPPPPPDPEMQAQWRKEAEEREAKKTREHEQQLKQEQELEELRQRFEGGSRGSDVDIPDLARRVYPLIRRLLQQDRERR
jgi:hypothetical protein